MQSSTRVSPIWVPPCSKVRPPEFGRHLAGETDKGGKVAKFAGIKVNDLMTGERVATTPHADVAGR